MASLPSGSEGESHPCGQLPRARAAGQHPVWSIQTGGESVSLKTPQPSKAGDCGGRCRSLPRERPLPGDRSPSWGHVSNAEPAHPGQTRDKGQCEGLGLEILGRGRTWTRTKRQNQQEPGSAPLGMGRGRHCALSAPRRSGRAWVTRQHPCRGRQVTVPAGMSRPEPRAPSAGVGWGEGGRRPPAARGGPRSSPAQTERAVGATRTRKGNNDMERSK